MLDFLPFVVFSGGCGRYLQNWSYGNQIVLFGMGGVVVCCTFQQVSVQIEKLTRALNKLSHRMTMRLGMIRGMGTNLEKLSARLSGSSP